MVGGAAAVRSWGPFRAERGAEALRFLAGSRRQPGFCIVGSVDENVTTVFHLHQMAVQRFYERRRLEWRLSMAVWASLLAAAGFLTAAADHLKASWPIVLFACGAAGLHAYMEGHYFAGPSRRDWREGVALAQWLRSDGRIPAELAKELDKLSPLPLRSEYHLFRAHWWQVAVTAALGAVLSWAVSVASGAPVFP